MEFYNLFLLVSCENGDSYAEARLGKGGTRISFPVVLLSKSKRLSHNTLCIFHPLCSLKIGCGTYTSRYFLSAKM
jgi:hypothetical protein